MCLFLQLLMIFRLERFLYSRNIIRTPCIYFIRFEKTFTLEPINFLKANQMQNVLDPKNATLKFFS